MSHGWATQNYETDNVKFPLVGKINKSVTLSGVPVREERREGERGEEGGRVAPSSMFTGVATVRVT